MPESEYRLLIHEPGPHSDPVPMIVTRSRERTLSKSFGRHTWELVMGLLPSLLLVTFFGGWLAIHQPPKSYATALSATPELAMRPQLIESLEETTAALINQADEKKAEGWSVEFTQMQLNSWLADRFPQMEGDWSELGLKDPRLLIDPKAVDLGFRIEQAGEDEYWSLRLRPNVTGPRQITLQILGVRLGLVPIPLDQLALEPEGVVQGEDWEVDWSYAPENHLLTINFPEESGILPLSKLELLPETIRFEGQGTSNPPENAPAAESVDEVAPAESEDQKKTPANPEELTPTAPGK